MMVSYKKMRTYLLGIFWPSWCKENQIQTGLSNSNLAIAFFRDQVLTTFNQNPTETKKILSNSVIGIHEENGVISLVTEQGTISSYIHAFHNHQ